MRRTAILFMLAFTAPLAGAGCSLVTDWSALGPHQTSGGGGGTSTTAASSSSGGGAGGGACPDNHGPAMVRVPGTGFCIDATEVTQHQYAEFIADVAGHPDSVTVPPFCAWNTTYDNVGAFNGPIPVSEWSLPVVRVDWCDAYVFCAWAGKRLCGRVGGGAVSGTDALDFEKGQWTYACTQEGAQLFPYGHAPSPSTCNTSDHGGGDISVTDAGALPLCEGGYPGLFDMSGNVWEWIDYCELPDGGPGGPDDKCYAYGGSADTPSDKASCNDVSPTYRSFNYYLTGFRCCAP